MFVKMQKCFVFMCARKKMTQKIKNIIKVTSLDGLAD